MPETIKIIIEVVAVVLIVFAMGFMKLKEELSVDIVKLIAEAETKPLTGAEKMKWLVETVYDTTIPLAKAYFTKDRIQKLAQMIFDNIRKYADRYKERNDLK